MQCLLLIKLLNKKRKKLLQEKNIISHTKPITITFANA
jgi:hypothetical protein